MKFLLVLVSFFALSNALDQAFKDKLMEKMQEYGAKCLEEVHASDNDIAELIAHKIPPTSHEAKCMIFCMHKSFNMMTPDGKPDREGTLQTLDPLKEADAELYDISVKVLDKCSASTEIDADPCITSSNWAECGVREGKALGVTEDIFEM